MIRSDNGIIKDNIDNIISYGKRGSGVPNDGDFRGSRHMRTETNKRLDCKRMYSHYVRMSDCRFPRDFPFVGGAYGAMFQGGARANENTTFPNNLKNSVRYVHWFLQEQYDDYFN